MGGRDSGTSLSYEHFRNGYIASYALAILIPAGQLPATVTGGSVMALLVVPEAAQGA